MLDLHVKDPYEAFIEELNKPFDTNNANIAALRKKIAESEGIAIDPFTGLPIDGSSSSDGSNSNSNSDDSTYSSNFVERTIQNSQALSGLYQNQVMGSSAWVDPSKDGRLAHYTTPSSQPNIAALQSTLATFTARTDQLSHEPKTVPNVIALQDAALSQAAVAGSVVMAGGASQGRSQDIIQGIKANRIATDNRDALRTFVGEQLHLSPEQQANLKTMSNEDFTKLETDAYNKMSPDEQKKFTQAYADKSKQIQKDNPLPPVAGGPSPALTFDVESPDISNVQIEKEALVKVDTSNMFVTPPPISSAASQLHDGGDIQAPPVKSTFNQVSPVTNTPAAAAPAPAAAAPIPAPQQQPVAAPAAPAPAHP